MASYAQRAGDLLEGLCDALGRSSDYPEFLALQDFFLQGWGGQEIPERPLYPSAIGDDHSPYEYSVAFGVERVELRLLVEMQAPHPSPLPNQHAALEFNRRLARQYGADFGRFNTVQDLFVPPNPMPPFSIWHAACLGHQKRHDFKAYLNPQVRGQQHAKSVVTDALTRLGLGDSVRFIEQICSMHSGRNTMNYFSLDLSKAPTARVKVYFQHTDASADELEQIFSLVPAHRPGDVAEFCAQVAGGAGPFKNKPVTSCLSFVEGSAAPTAGTFHFPIARYVPNDATTMERVGKYLTSHGIDEGPYYSALQSVAVRPLEQAAGIQSYASFRREAAGLRFTAYLSPELFSETGRQAWRAIPPRRRSKVAAGGSR